jgi:Lar family restriction alleviation protein
MDELKTCPFCGGDATISEKMEHDDFTMMDGFIVFCPSCGCATDCMCLEEEAIAAWNRRADGWVSVENGVPEKECIATCAIPENREYGELIIGYVGKRDDSQTGYIAETESEILHNVTHWMPLPQPPCEIKQYLEDCEDCGFCDSKKGE